MKNQINVNVTIISGVIPKASSITMPLENYKEFIKNQANMLNMVGLIEEEKTPIGTRKVMAINSDRILHKAYVTGGEVYEMYSTPLDYEFMFIDDNGILHLIDINTIEKFFKEVK